MRQLFKVYLDQNVLQYDFEGKIKIPNSDQVQYIYSDEHFNEITRWENDGYFSVLKRLKARKIGCNLDSNSKFTDNDFLFDYADPKTMYEEYKDTIKNNESTGNLLQLLQVFFSGNKTITTPKEINRISQDTMKELLGDSFRYLGNSELESKYNLLAKTIGDQLENFIRDQEFFSLDKIRKKLTKKILSNLDPKDGLVIDQIWNLINDEITGIDKDQLFGKVAFYFQSDFLYSKFQNVIHCHSLLNTLGYWPDGGLAKMSKIYGINSDALHLAYSIFCDGIMSGDDRMCKKGEAIFAYIDIRTKIFKLKMDATNKSSVKP